MEFENRMRRNSIYRIGVSDFLPFRLSGLKIFYFLFLLAPVQSCSPEDTPECFKSTGTIVSRELKVEPFDELIVYGRIKMFIEQGDEHKVMVESGANLIGDIKAEVQEGRLSLRNGNECNFFREYDVTKIYVTVPNLTWLQHAGNQTIEGIGPLVFPDIWLRSLNQEKDPDIYTNGDFDLELVSDQVRITSDGYSNFFLKGETHYFDIYIADDDSRVEAKDLVAGIVEIRHRGTNKLFVNPQQILRGEIRSTGDVISVNRPPTVDIETFYTGKLIFQ